MLVRNCAGGVVFFEEKVLILKNDKKEWILPKGVIRGNELPGEVAKKRVKEEAGVSAEIVSTAGHTNYEFYSSTRRRPVCNKITWYIMKSSEEKFSINEKENFLDGGFFDVKEAINLITYSQDKSLLSLSHKRFLDIGEN